jgi:adenosylmethionine-8-amino-7-oxononanoate aminotransferase
MVRLSAYSTFGDQSNRPAIELAEHVGRFAPVPDSKVFLTSGGSDSIDTATKMARRYWQLRGETERTLLVTRQHAYHGMHVAGTSLAGIEANAAGHGPLVGDVVKIACHRQQCERDPDPGTGDRGAPGLARARPHAR